MVDTTTQQTASLRRLVPRIFSRAQQPAGAVDTLLKTVRMHHPKADLALIERAYTVAERAHSGQTRRRRMSLPSSASRESTTRESGWRQYGHRMLIPPKVRDSPADRRNRHRSRSAQRPQPVDDLQQCNH